MPGKRNKGGYYTPDSHLKRMPYPREMTMPTACVSSHNVTLRESHDEGWVREVIPGLMVRFEVD